MTADFEDINDFQAVLSRVLDVTRDHVVLCISRDQGPDVALELLIVCVDWIWYLISFTLLPICTTVLHYIIGDLNVKQVRHKIVLLLHLLQSLHNEAAHLLHAEVVRNVSVELLAVGDHRVSILLVDCLFQLAEDCVAFKHSFFR